MRAAAAVVATRDGQRMAALPAAVVADALGTGRASAAGVHLASQVVSAATLLAAVAESGFDVIRS
jgi:hypothetical protein